MVGHGVKPCADRCLLKIRNRVIQGLAGFAAVNLTVALIVGGDAAGQQKLMERVDCGSGKRHAVDDPLPDPDVSAGGADITVKYKVPDIVGDIGISADRTDKNLMPQFFQLQEHPL